MPDQNSNNEITTLEDLHRVFDASPHVVIGWIYPKVMACLTARFSNVPESERQDAFDDAARGFAAAVLKASTVEEFIRLACHRAKLRLLTLLKKRKATVGWEGAENSLHGGAPTEQPVDAAVANGVANARVDALRRYLDEVRPLILPKLTRTQIRLLGLLEKGFTNPEVAATMGWTIDTACVRKSELFKKMRGIVKKLEKSFQ